MNRASIAKSYSAILIVLGLGVGLGGISAVSRELVAGNLVRTGYGVRNGGLMLSLPELLTTASRLAAATAPSPNAEEAGALTFLDYAAAMASMDSGDKATMTRELAAARIAAVQTLSLAPTRADVSLALAEIELLSGKDREAISRPLLLSYVTAPRELWIIERRIAIGLRLAAEATPDLMPHILSDIRTLGEPFRSTDYYLELARAARNGGPYAIALVRRELAAIDDQPLQAFNADLDKLASAARTTAP